jgi:hypothetical protein
MEIITADGRTIHIKNFPFTAGGGIAAAHAYEEKARELFGQFATVNFPANGEHEARP